jgi:hypothetical protein
VSMLRSAIQSQIFIVVDVYIKLHPEIIYVTLSMEGLSLSVEAVLRHKINYFEGSANFLHLKH